MAEEQIIPTREPIVTDVVFVNPDRTQAPGGFTVTIPGCAPWQDRRRRMTSRHLQRLDASHALYVGRQREKDFQR